MGQYVIMYLIILVVFCCILLRHFQNKSIRSPWQKRNWHHVISKSLITILISGAVLGWRHFTPSFLVYYLCSPWPGSATRTNRRTIIVWSFYGDEGFVFKSSYILRGDSLSILNNFHIFSYLSLFFYVVENFQVL